MNLQNQIFYLKSLKNENMFDGVSVPAPLNPEQVVDKIIWRCGLLEPAYTEPEVMHEMINLWFVTNQWNFEHLVNIILAEYSPIENTDRYSEHTIDRSGDSTTSHAGKDTMQEKLSGTDQRDYSESGTDQRDITESGTDQRDIVEGGTTSIGTENTISAFNASTYQPDNKSDSTTTHGKTTDDDITYGKTTDDDITYGKSYDDDVTYGKQTDSYTVYGHNITSRSNGKDIYTEHTHGNIGTVTNQSMIEAELRLLEHFNIYDWIAAKFERELCLQIY